MIAQLSSERRAMLAKVHVAKKQLNLTDEDYRANLRRVTGKNSAADCSDAELHRLLAEFRRLGFDDRGQTRRSEKAHVRKVYAVWGDVRRLLGHDNDHALHSFVARQTKSAKSPDGISSPEWLDPIDANKVIEGLKAWRARLLREREGADAAV